MRAAFVDGMKKTHVLNEHLSARKARESPDWTPLVELREASLYFEIAFRALVPTAVRIFDGYLCVEHVTAH